MLRNRDIVTYLLAANQIISIGPSLNFIILVCDCSASLKTCLFLLLSFSKGIQPSSHCFVGNGVWQSPAEPRSMCVCYSGGVRIWGRQRWARRGGEVDRQFDYSPKWYEMKWEMEIVMSVAGDEGGNEALSREVALKRAPFIPQISNR